MENHFSLYSAQLSLMNNQNICVHFTNNLFPYSTTNKFKMVKHATKQILIIFNKKLLSIFSHHVAPLKTCMCNIYL
jgi:hypothetical protein